MTTTLDGRERRETVPRSDATAAWGIKLELHPTPAPDLAACPFCFPSPDRIAFEHDESPRAQPAMIRRGISSYPGHEVSDTIVPPVSAPNAAARSRSTETRTSGCPSSVPRRTFRSAGSGRSASSTWIASSRVGARMRTRMRWSRAGRSASC